MKSFKLHLILILLPLFGLSQTDVSVESILLNPFAPYSYGNNVNFQITIRNNGPLAVKNISIADIVPCGLNYTGGSQSWSLSGSDRITIINSTLNPGQSTSVSISFDILPCLLNNAWQNTVMVVAYEDINDINIFSADTNTGNNFLTEELPVFDLALRKSLTTPAPYEYGDTLSFNIEIHNQGNQPVSGFLINDYFPAGVGYYFDPTLNPMWSGGPSVYNRWVSLSPALNPGGVETISIDLVLIRTSGGNRAWVNYAEIASATDILSNPIFDADSFYGSNSIQENNVLPGTMNDDNLNSTGLGNNDDDDDHDPAGAEIFDLALTKIQGSALLSFSYLQDVEYVFTIYNQGSVPATNIEITDYLSPALQYMSSPKNLLRGWNYNNILHTAKKTYTNILLPGQSDTIKLDLMPIQFYVNPNDAWTDFAEISDADDTDPNTALKPIDLDSSPDSINGNDAGGRPNSPSDNFINGDGSGLPGSAIAASDEDDHDPHKIQIFDLALRKTKITPGSFFQVGEDVVFEITVYNQGNVPAKNIVVSDYVPAGFDFISGGANAGWTGTEPLVKYTYSPVLFPGTNTSFQITLRVQSSMLPNAYLNYAEVSAAMDTLNNNRNDDADSILDDNPNNDNMALPGSPEDDDILGNSFFGGDQDDHDVAGIQLLCQQPTLTVGIPVCDPGNGTYSVTFYSNVPNIASNAGVISGNKISGIILGTDVTVTASNGANCDVSLTVLSPASCPGTGGCTFPTLSVGQPICTGGGFWSVSYSRDIGIMGTSGGTVGANSIFNIPIGTNITVTASNGFCISRININSPVNCGVPCANSPITISGPVCETNGAGTYKVNFIADAGTNVTASIGTLSAGMVTDIPSGINLTLTVVTPGCDTRVIIVPAGDCPVCQQPTLTVGIPECDPGNGTYSVTYYSNVPDISSSAGVITGYKITGINLGTNINVTASNGANCNISLTVLSPSSCPGTGGCTYPKLTVGQPLCNGGSYSVSYTSDFAPVTSSAGIVGATTIFNIPLGTNITVSSSNGNCTSRVNVSSPANCGVPCANSPITISGPICETNGPGTYKVNFSANSGTTVLASIGNLSTGMVTDIPTGVSLTLTVITPGCDNRVIAVPAGDCALGNASVGSFVWHDINGDGQQSFGEPGIPGVHVVLYDQLSNIIAQTSTNANGQYLFTDVIPGNYYIRFNPPSNFEFTFINIGNDDFDSDAGAFNGPGTTEIFTLLPGENDLSIDAGLYRCVPIGDLVWYDTNKNDIFNTNEHGINGLRVNLWRNNFGVWQVWGYKYTGPKPGSPSDDGYFNFCAPPGTYFVEVIMPPLGLVRARQDIGFDEEIDSDIGANSRTNQFTVTSGQVKNDLGAGFYPMAVAGNLVWRDDNLNGIQDVGEAKVQGVMVEAVELITGNIAATAITDADGIYSLDYLEKQSYFLKFTPPAGYTATIPGATTDNLDSDVDHSYGINTTRAFSMEPSIENQNIDMGIAFGVLPVEWLNIYAKRIEKGNLVSWTVSREWNVSHYIIERKAPGDNEFKELIEKINISGNKQGNTSYTFTDGDKLLQGICYYRVKQVDLDGKFSYSEIVYVNGSDAFGLNIYPNPARSLTSLEILQDKDALIDVDLLDSNGKFVKNLVSSQTIKKGENQIILQLTEIPGGVYLIRVTDRNGFIADTKLIVID